MQKIILSAAFCSFAAIAGLSDCAGANDTTLKSVEYACASATVALKATNVLVPATNTDAQTKITHAVHVLNPICSQDKPPTLDSTAHAALTAALAELSSVLPQ